MLYNDFLNLYMFRITIDYNNHMSFGGFYWPVDTVTSYHKTTLQQQTPSKISKSTRPE